MGKWNKTPPTGVSEQFLQNEQRRKQLIIEAARRRKQKDKKLQTQQQANRKCQQQALSRHKQDKKDAYVKYLRNNMHDKYQQLKRRQKSNQPQTSKVGSKWNKSGINNESQMNRSRSHSKNKHLQGLNLQVNMPGNRGKREPNPKLYSEIQKQLNSHKQEQQNLSSDVHKKESKRRRMLENQFQEMWGQDNSEKNTSVLGQDDLLGSQLLDSLDLDGGSVSRAKQYKKQLNEKAKVQQLVVNKDVNQIKDMIGYQSVLVSIDERSQMLKKYKELMQNQVQDKSLAKKQINDKNTTPVDVGKGGARNSGKSNKSQQRLKKDVKQKPRNEGEVFNQLKNKVQGKILNWASQETEEADDLFSNCSSRKTRKAQQIINNIGGKLKTKSNIQIRANTTASSSQSGFTSNKTQIQPNMKKKEKTLQSIPERRFSTSKERLRERSYEKKMQTANSMKNVGSTGNQKVNATFSGGNTRKQSSKNKYPPPPIPSANKSTGSGRNLRVTSTELNRPGRTHQSNENSSKSKQKPFKTIADKIKETRQRMSERNGSNNHRNLSKEKQNRSSQDKCQPPSQKSQVVSSTKKIPPPSSSQHQANRSLQSKPPVLSYERSQPQYDQITIATQDQVFQVESFIKNQLVSLNKEQRLMQEQLRQIHLKSKDQLRQIKDKYQIKTDYKHSAELQAELNGEQVQQDLGEEEEDLHSNCRSQSYSQQNKKQTQDQLEDSIQRLDDMLLRREIYNKDGKGTGNGQSRITEQDNESESSSSMIQPMCDPITLHKQVLQLAQNLSRFEKDPQQIQGGYGHKVRMMKKNKPPASVTASSKQQLPSNLNKNEEHKHAHKKGAMECQQMVESQDVSLSQLNYAHNVQNSYEDSLGYGKQENDLEDSIEKGKGKIIVNQKLKNMLFDD